MNVLTQEDTHAPKEVDNTLNESGMELGSTSKLANFCLEFLRGEAMPLRAALLHVLSYSSYWFSPTLQIAVNSWSICEVACCFSTSILHSKHKKSLKKDFSLGLFGCTTLGFFTVAVYEN